MRVKCLAHEHNTIGVGVEDITCDATSKSHNNNRYKN